MRADRLVAILLLLQQRQRVTADEVAAELEISSRTARRDLEALGVAGLPVYSMSGRNGGWYLAGGGRTDLSGLTAAEAQALFLVAGPSAATTPELKAALRKLVRALPEQFRSAAEQAAASVVIDERAGEYSAPRRPPPPMLAPVQQAVINGQQLLLRYTSVTRPEGFDLGEAWAIISERVDQLRAPVLAHALAHQEMVGVLGFAFGTRLEVGPVQPGGRVEVQVRGHSPESLTGELGGFGAAVEVLTPPELRDGLARLARELALLYG